MQYYTVIIVHLHPMSHNSALALCTGGDQISMHMYICCDVSDVMLALNNCVSKLLPHPPISTVIFIYYLAVSLPLYRDWMATIQQIIEKVGIRVFTTGCIVGCGSMKGKV